MLEFLLVVTLFGADGKPHQSVAKMTDLDVCFTNAREFIDTMTPENLAKMGAVAAAAGCLEKPAGEPS